MYVRMQDIHGGIQDVHGAQHDGDVLVRDDALLERDGEHHDDVLVHGDEHHDDVLVRDEHHGDVQLQVHDEQVHVHDLVLHVREQDENRALLLLVLESDVHHCVLEQQLHDVRLRCENHRLLCWQELPMHDHLRYCVLALKYVYFRYVSAVHNLLPT